jgi:CRISPR/Cas system endoribonuclease Cas6 (RAMP superfamily)
MNIKSGLEIVDSHRGYKDRIKELEEVLLRLEEYSYAKGVLQVQLAKLREELVALENTRFQTLEPVTIVKSALGGHDSYIS